VIRATIAGVVVFGAMGVALMVGASAAEAGGCATKAEFARIKAGMTLSQVAKVFGTKGIDAGEEGNAPNIAHRVYPSCSSSGAAEAFFVDGRLTRKYWM
jgi:hypothetical protein